MRIWSIHPKYLDTKGLVALWRESLLAKHVLEGKTKGYINHPQLIRFKNTNNPLIFINQYLYYVYLEANNRGYSFSRDKFVINNINEKININKGQVNYEFNHLLTKLEKRDNSKYLLIKNTIKIIELHPIFNIIEGDIEEWEIIKGRELH